jgi:prevent-host-death family protein
MIRLVVYWSIHWEPEMKEVGIYEARVHFGDLMRKVEEGETIIVTRHGRPIAKFCPLSGDTNDPAAAMEAIHRFRRLHRPSLGGLSLRELIEEGRE